MSIEARVARRSYWYLDSQIFIYLLMLITSVKRDPDPGAKEYASEARNYEGKIHEKDHP